MRFYACFLALCSVVSICSGQERCCINHNIYTVSGDCIIGVHGGQHLDIIEQSAIIVVDYDQSRFLFNVTVTEGGNTTKILLIDDVNQNTTWVIYPDSQECWKEPLANATDRVYRCIAGDAQYLDQVNNPGDVLVNRWQFVYTSVEKGGGPEEFTKDGCLRNGGSFVGKLELPGSHVDMLYGFSYYNFEVLTDASEYFILPSYCNPTSYSQPIKRKATEAAKRFVKRLAVNHQRRNG